MKKILIVITGLLMVAFLAGFLSANERAVIVDSFASGARVQHVDDSGGSVQIDITHYKIHECESFVAADYTASLAIATPKYYQITNKNTVKDVHVNPILVTVDGSALLEYSTDQTVGTKGVTITAKNPNGECAVSTFTLVKVYEDTNTTNGSATWIPLLISGGGSVVGAQGNRAGGTNTLREEIVIKAGDTVIYKITSQTDSEKVLIRFPWYEE